jgi:hypothetical protein
MRVEGPGEVRWGNQVWRIGYLGEDRWCVGASEMFTAELVRRLASEVERADGGEVHLIVPGRHDVISVVVRADLRGVLPAQCAPVDVRSVTTRKGTSVVQTPFVNFVHPWLVNNSERAWAADAIQPLDRFGEDFAPDCFVRDGAALAERLGDAFTRRLRASKDPAATFALGVRELAALGHDTDFADENGGEWAAWAAGRLSIQADFSPGAELAAAFFRDA